MSMKTKPKEQNHRRKRYVKKVGEWRRPEPATHMLHRIGSEIPLDEVYLKLMQMATPCARHTSPHLYIFLFTLRGAAVFSLHSEVALTIHHHH